MANPQVTRVLRFLAKLLTSTSTDSTTSTTTVRTSGRSTHPDSGTRATSTRKAQSGGTPTAPGRVATGYAGDFVGAVHAEYAPDLDGDADPGEIVWTWVPYEEDYTQGKDRPVLIVGREGALLLAVMLTSKDHSRNRTTEERHGRYWIDIGTGAWDPKGRESEIRLDRVIQVDAHSVRREGAVLDRATFDQVIRGIAAHR